MNSLLERELREAKNVVIKRDEKMLESTEEVRALLEGAGQKDREIMRHLAPKSLLIANENSLGANLELKTFDKEYAGHVYHIDQIKQLCVDYRLRFLSSKHFTGFMDVEVIAKVNQFAEETSTPIDQHTLGTRFFIMAPAKCFHIEEVVEVREVINRDPIIFYKVDDSHYRLIHKWGKDFTILRRLIGWRWENATNHRHFYFLVNLPIIATLFALIGPFFFAAHFLVCAILIVFLSYILAAIFNTSLYKTNRQNNQEINEDMISTTNWNCSVKTKTVDA